jgi:hypothetical protein
LVKIKEAMDSGKHDQDSQSNSEETLDITPQPFTQHRTSTSTEPLTNPHGYDRTNNNSNDVKIYNNNTRTTTPINEHHQRAPHGDINHTSLTTHNTTNQGHRIINTTYITRNSIPQTHVPHAASTSTESLTCSDDYNNNNILHYTNTSTPFHQSATQGNTNNINIIQHNTNEPNQLLQQQRTLFNDISTPSQATATKADNSTQYHCTTNATQIYRMTTEDNNYEEEKDQQQTKKLYTRMQGPTPPRK